MNKVVARIALVVFVLLLIFVSNAGAVYKNNCAHDIIGDVNGDSMVNISDFSLLSVAWKTRVGQPGFNVRADMNCDGIISEPDLEILKLGYSLRVW